jgi:hypothetical protein
MGMKTSEMEKGCLVKNIRNDEIGVIVNNNDSGINDDSQFYEVLTDGKIVKWFKPNIVHVDIEDFDARKNIRLDLMSTV